MYRPFVLLRKSKKAYGFEKRWEGGVLESRHNRLNVCKEITSTASNTSAVRLKSAVNCKERFCGGAMGVPELIHEPGGHDAVGEDDSARCNSAISATLQSCKRQSR